MKIIFYSTNSNIFNDRTFKINVYPSNEKMFVEFKNKHPEHEFICITQKPGMFLSESSIFLDQNLNYKEVALRIAEYKPDLVVAFSYWVAPFDWLSINDALVKEELDLLGIKTICNSVQTGLICFDKYKTHQFLELNGFNIPKAVFVDHSLYFCAGSNKNVINNVYRQSIYSQLKQLKLPLIIKDTVGLSSYGMTVVDSYGKAIEYLNSKRNNSNRIIEEYISGEQFGIEVYGNSNKKLIFPPYKFSLNQYGISSPKQTCKFGPIMESKYKIKKLYKQILKLVNLLDIQTSAQIDLIFNKNKWYIIEINPRLSGMSFMYAKSINKSIFDLIYENCIENKIFKRHKFYKKNKNYLYSFDIKLPVMSIEVINEISKLPNVVLLNQTNDLNAKQEREKGFCECLICSNNKTNIYKTLLKIKEYFPNDSIIQQSELMLK